MLSLFVPLVDARRRENSTGPGGVRRLWMLRNSLRREVSRFSKDETGVVTIEFVMVVPFFMILFTFFLDACMIYFTYNDMITASHEAARRISTGELKSLSEVHDYVAARMIYSGTSYSLSVEMSRAEKTVTIEAPVTEAALFGGLFDGFIGANLSASALVRGEPLL